MFLIPVFNNKFVKLFMLPFSFVFLAPEPLTLILYHDQHVRTAVAALKLVPLYNNILQLEQYKPPKEGVVQRGLTHLLVLHTQALVHLLWGTHLHPKSFVQPKSTARKRGTNMWERK